jgi:hypothetical protein
MRVIEKQLLQALNERKNANLGNTMVIMADEGNTMLVRLHGNLIASINLPTNKVKVSNCGWLTNVTKSRLNVVLLAFGKGTISQKKGVWYIGQVPFSNTIETL